MRYRLKSAAKYEGSANQETKVGRENALFLKSGAVFLVLLMSGWISTASSQQVPSSRDQVAQPGGNLPGNAKIELVKIAEGLEGPVNVTNAGDRSDRIFVVERIGRVKIIDKNGQIGEQPFLDLTALRPSVINPSGNDVQSEFIEQGLLSIAFHPDYSENGYFYVHYTSVRANGAGVITRFQVDPKSPDFVSPERARDTEKVIMQIDQPSYNNNGGEIAFGPDGYLYIGLGDGGFGAPENASQELSTRLGKILRIDVDSGDPYSAPADNPFAAKGGTPQDEIWAIGFHNPYKFAFDDQTGGLFIADVGDSHWEEINYISAQSKGGENFGWPKMEGTECYPILGSEGNQECNVVGSLPIAQYRHPDKNTAPDADTGALACASVQGLGVANYGGLQGAYLFGDWCSGDIFGVGWDGDRWLVENLLQTDLHITAGGLDEDGNVLVLSAKFYFDEPNPDVPPYGTVWRIVSK